jgi:hypothetical protein
LFSFLLQLLGLKDQSLFVELFSTEVDVPTRLSSLNFDVVIAFYIPLFSFDCKSNLLHLEDILLSVNGKVREILVEVLNIQVLME